MYMHVHTHPLANHIFEAAIGPSGMLQDKTRVVVLSSHLALLQDFDVIVMMGHDEEGMCVYVRGVSVCVWQRTDRFT
jgi:hypothetical protein